jgi:O-antigen/teichoic acid export membrane protein
MRIYAIALLLGGLDATAGAVLRVFDRFRLAFLTSVSSFALRLMIVIELVDRGSGLDGLVWGRVVAELVTTLILGTAAFMLLKKALWPHRGAAFAALRGLRREILHFLVHMNLQGSLKAVATKLDVLCVGVLAGPGAVGLYKVAVQLGSSPLLFADPLFTSVYPLFSRWYAVGQAREIRSVGRKSSIILTVVAVPTAVVLAVESRQLLSFLFGPDFADAAWPMTIVLIGVLPTVLFFWGRAAILASGNARAATGIVTAATIAQFAALFALTPFYGASGAAVGFALTSIVSVLMTARYLHRKKLL